MKQIFRIFLFLIIVSCSKDETASDSENPYSIKRISKIEIRGKNYLTEYYFKYNGNKLVKIEEIESSTDILDIYKESYEYFYFQSGDTTSMSYSSGIGYEEYSYEYKFLIDNLRLGAYTRMKHNYTGGYWRDYDLVYRLSNNKIVELISESSSGNFITYYQYSGDKLIKSIKKSMNNEDPKYYEVISEKNYTYSGNSIKISSDNSEINITLKNGKIESVIEDEYEPKYFTYYSDGMLSEIRDGNKTQKIFYENGSAKLDFFKLYIHHHEFEIDPLFNLLYAEY